MVEMTKAPCAQERGHAEGRGCAAPGELDSYDEAKQALCRGSRSTKITAGVFESNPPIRLNAEGAEVFNAESAEPTRESSELAAVACDQWHIHPCLNGWSCPTFFAPSALSALKRFGGLGSDL